MSEIKTKLRTELITIAKFQGIDPCKRCENPWCDSNIPDYNRWDLLIPLYSNWYLYSGKLPSRIERDHIISLFQVNVACNNIEEAIKTLSGAIGIYNQWNQ